MRNLQKNVLTIFDEMWYIILDTYGHNPLEPSKPSVFYTVYICDFYCKLGWFRWFGWITNDERGLYERILDTKKNKRRLFT